MKTRSACALFFLLTAVTSNPVMKYSLCSQSDPQCEPTNFASGSPLEFGNITSGVYYYESGDKRSLTVSCTFHEPLHWILTADDDFRFNPVSSNVTTNGLNLLYFYHIHANEIKHGLIRCESYNDSNLAAEIYIAQRSPANAYRHWVDRITRFLLRSPQREGQLIVPCVMYKFDPSLDTSTLRLQKLRQSEMMMSKVSPKCFNCFPRDERKKANCATSCPYNISEKLWNDAGRQLHDNKTGNQWLDCIRDYKCAFETVTIGSKFEKVECNGDHENTCSDYISAITSYPDSCVQGSTSYANFVNTEACILKNLAQSFESTEVDYDPRLGFRVKTEKDMDAVYICSSNTSAVYMTTYDPSTKHINARLEGTENDTNGPLKGLYCTVPQPWMENFHMNLVACSTLFECELQLQTLEGQTHFRKSNTIVLGEKISTIYPREAGKIVQDPPTSGVARCFVTYKPAFGYIWDMQYFFTGLNSKLYFLSNSNVPTEAVMSFRATVQTDLSTSNGIQIEMECTVATFIVFPSFQFLVEYSNGTIRKTDRMCGVHSLNKDSHSASYRLNKSTGYEASIVSVRCRAPFRNSGTDTEAVLLANAFTIKSDDQGQNTNGIEIADSSSSSQVYLVVILTVVMGIILLASIACAIYAARKYKKSTASRQLTFEEINGFLNGNAALATGSSNELNVDGIGFPQCFQIAAMDLKMHTQEVLGEGEFGRCVSGHFHEQKVAVKTTKASMDVEAFKQFLREIKIMAYLGKQENIVEFLGAVVDQLRDRICIAVVELSPYGDLLSYLRQKDSENPSDANLYTNISSEEPLEDSESSKLGLNHLSYFCEQIASAMEFVVEKRVIHGDLAARNVLLFPNFVVKITDFGLSRKLYTASNYKKTNLTPLPWRWMAIESLKYMEFSPMTDMWSYGVTVFEIFSGGEVPYAGIVYSREFVDELEQGRRLQRPKNASEEIYEFMTLTWDRIPNARPSFKEAKNLFGRNSVGIQKSCN